MTAVCIIAGAMLLWVAFIIGMIYWDLLTKPIEYPPKLCGDDKLPDTCDNCRFNRCSWRGTYGLKDCGAWEAKEKE